MGGRTRTPTGLVLVIGAVTVLTACTSGTSGPRKTVTVEAPTPSPTVVTPSGSSTAGSGSTSPSTTPGGPTGTPLGAPPAKLAKLPGRCDTQLPEPSIDTAVGHSVTGYTAFVVGVPEADIGRVGYLNCRYGLASKSTSAIPGVEIGVSLYKTVAQATGRITATAADYVAHGATATSVSVGGLPGKILVGASAQGYQTPTLVLSTGQRTIAVSVTDKISGTGKRDQVLANLAELAVTQTK